MFTLSLSHSRGFVDHSLHPPLLAAERGTSAGPSDVEVAVHQRVHCRIGNSEDEQGCLDARVDGLCAVPVYEVPAGRVN